MTHGRSRSMRWRPLALAMLMGCASGACGSNAYDVTKNLSYDSAIGDAGAFDVLEAAARPPGHPSIPGSAAR